MKQRDFNKKLILNKKTISTLNGDLMRAVKGGNKDPHDPSDDCDTGGGGSAVYTCFCTWDCTFSCVC